MFPSSIICNSSVFYDIVDCVEHVAQNCLNRSPSNYKISVLHEICILTETRRKYFSSCVDRKFCYCNGFSNMLL